MSNKIIAAVVVAGGVLATTPFYLSGFFAHKALSEQIHSQMSQLGIDPTAISIANEASELGLYKSHFAYDTVFNMEHPQLVALKSEGVPSTLTLRVENNFTHGFLSIEGSSTYSGNFVDTLDKAIKQANFIKKDADKPLFSVNTSADFSLTGHYQIKMTSNMQPFSMSGVSADGEAFKLESSPMTLNGVVTPETMEFSYNQDKVTIEEGGALFAINSLTMGADGNMWFSNELDTMLIKEFKSNFGVADITITGDGNSMKVAEKVSIDYDVSTNEQLRGQVGVRYQVEKIEIPMMPMGKIDNLDIHMVLEGGVKGALAYYEKIQTFAANPEDPEIIMELFGNLLAEDVGYDVKAFKAQTFAGLVDITADIDLKALDAAEFKQNPMLALANLSYKAAGEVPMDLLAMSGQLPPEAIDSLVQQQMLEVKDGQVHFKLDGSAGSVNLNGKPLM